MKLLPVLLLFLLVPSVVAELTTEDRQFIARVNSDAVNQVNGNIDARGQECVGYLDGKTNEAKDLLSGFRVSVMWRIILGVFGAVFAGHFSAIMITNKLKGSSHGGVAVPKEVKSKGAQQPPPATPERWQYGK